MSRPLTCAFCDAVSERAIASVRVCQRCYDRIDVVCNTPPERRARPVAAPLPRCHCGNPIRGAQKKYCSTACNMIAVHERGRNRYKVHRDVARPPVLTHLQRWERNQAAKAAGVCQYCSGEIKRHVFPNGTPRGRRKKFCSSQCRARDGRESMRRAA